MKNPGLTLWKSSEQDQKFPVSLAAEANWVPVAEDVHGFSVAEGMPGSL